MFPVAISEVRTVPRGPNLPCPKCQAPDTYGVVAINDRSYIRECSACGEKTYKALPRLTKKLIYLDQFVISNMMKELDPEREEEKKGSHDGLFRKLFESLDRLSKLQLIVCPESSIHDHESMVSPHYKKIIRVLQQLSVGITFHDPSTIERWQIEHAFEAWKTQTPDPSPVSRRSVLMNNPDVWQGGFLITPNFHFPDLPKQLRAQREELTKRFRSLCEYWAKHPSVSLKELAAEEVAGCGRQLFKEHAEQMQRYIAYYGGLIGPDLVGLPTERVTMMTDFLQAFEDLSLPAAHAKVAEFFASTEFAQVESLRISALLWATLAQSVPDRNPDKYPRGGIFNDVAAISAYSPFCDAMFFDKEIAHLVNQGPLRQEFIGKARIFSLNNAAEFLAYLEQIEAEMPADHAKLVMEIYGPSWPMPFTNMLEKFSKPKGS